MNRTVLLLVLASLTGCAASAPPPPVGAASTPSATPETVPQPLPRRLASADAPFRASAPPLEAPSPSAPPPIRQLRLSNGVRVVLLEQHLPALVQIDLVLRTPPAPLGANGILGDAVWLGTVHRSQKELYEARDAELAVTRSWSGPGYLGLGIRGLSSHTSSMVALLAEVALEPKLEAASVLRHTSNVFHNRERQDDVPETIAARIAPMALRGWDHPDDNLATARASDIGALTKDDIVHAYEAAFDPSRATLVVAGDTTPATILPVLENAFGSWKSHAQRAKGKPLPSATKTKGTPSTSRLVVVDRPGSPQSYVRIEGDGPAFDGGDQAPASVLVSIFGGPGGRVSNALEKERHLLSQSGTNASGGERPTFSWHGELPANQTAEGLRELDRQMRLLLDSDVPDAELAENRDRLVRQSSAWLASLSAASDRLDFYTRSGVSPDRIGTLPSRVEAVTTADVRRVAKRYLDPDRMKVIVVGDWSALHDQLLGLGWGSVEIRNTSGTVLRVEPAASPR